MSQILLFIAFAVTAYLVACDKPEKHDKPENTNRDSSISKYNANGEEV